MKKFLGVVVLGLLCCNVSFADYHFPLPKDVASGGGKYNKSLEKDFKKHGVQVVNKKDGHPVRAGKKSIRFEVKPGDCGYDDGWSDCKKDRERHELSGTRFGPGEKWYAWSIFIPKDFPIIYPSKAMFGQFYNSGIGPIFAFENQNPNRGIVGGYHIEKDFVDCIPEGSECSVLYTVASDEDMRGKWTDVLVHAKWSIKPDGFFKTWINNELKYEYEGKTLVKKKPKVYFKFGIYRSFMSRWRNKNNQQDVPGQVLYFDEVRVGKSKKKVVGKLPPLK